MVGAAGHETGDVRGGKADESDGAAECGDGAGKEDGGGVYHISGAADIKAHCHGVFLAQKEHVERLDGNDGEEQTDKHRPGQKGQLAMGNRAKGAHCPEDIGFQGCAVAEELHHLHEGVDAGAEHHAEYQDDHYVFHAVADGGDKKHHGSGSDPGCSGKAEVSGEAVANAGGGQAKHEEGCSEGGTGIDSEHERTGKRVPEKCLHDEAADGYGYACKKGCDSSHCSDFKDNGPCLRRHISTGISPDDDTWGNFCRARGEVQGKEQKKDGNRQENERLVFMFLEHLH